MASCILPILEWEVKALETLVKVVLREGVRIAEIGAWTGSSVLVMAREVLPYNGTIFAVDHWRGSPKTRTAEWAKGNDIYALFKQRMIIEGVWDIIHPLVMDSQTAASIFKDSILDLVYIDADHRYEYAKQDILYWLPKLRDGGILCGHDCEFYYSNLPEEIRKIIDRSNKNGEEAISVPPKFPCLHPGVIKALHNLFNDKYSIVPNSSIWYFKRRT